MSTHYICFRGEIRKILCGYPLLSVAMFLGEIINATFWILLCLEPDCIFSSRGLSNPFIPNGLFYSNTLDQSISNRRGVRLLCLITLQPLYNTVHYNTVLDITGSKIDPINA